MTNQQSESYTEIKNALDSILNGPLLGQISQKDQEKLINRTKQGDQLEFLLSTINKALKNTQEVIIRLKLLILLHDLLIRQVLEEKIEIIGSIIASHQSRLKQRDQNNKDTTDIRRFLIINVELPYLIFLRKMVAWQLAEISPQNTNHIHFGFCLLNKIKDIIALKKIFHNYGCYYASHAYAIDMFRTSLLGIRLIWREICQLVKDITLEAIKTNRVLAEEYLLICAAEEAQDMLMEYIYCGYFTKKVNNQQKIKYIVLLKPEIKALELERKKQSSEQQAMKSLLEKRESRRQLGKQSERRTGYSEEIEQKLNTEMQMEILDSILCLEALLGQ